MSSEKDRSSKYLHVGINTTSNDTPFAAAARFASLSLRIHIHSIITHFQPKTHHDAIIRSSSSARHDVKHINNSIPQNTYVGLGCNESYFIGEQIKLNFTAMEENVFCEGDIFPGVDHAWFGKVTTTCNGSDETVILTAYDVVCHVQVV